MLGDLVSSKVRYSGFLVTFGGFFYGIVLGLFETVWHCLAAFDVFRLCLTLRSLVVNNDELLILLQINKKIGT